MQKMWLQHTACYPYFEAGKGGPALTQHLPIKFNLEGDGRSLEISAATNMLKCFTNSFCCGPAGTLLLCSITRADLIGFSGCTGVKNSAVSMAFVDSISCPDFSCFIATLTIFLYNPFRRCSFGICWNTWDAIPDACPSNPAYTMVSRKAGSFFTRLPLRELFRRTCHSSFIL